MKIAHVNMFYLPTFGGVEQVMYELAQRQVQDGHEVHVYCCNSDKKSRLKKKEEIIDGVHIHRLSYLFRLSLNTFIWPSLLWNFNQRFDIVHTHVSGHLYILLMGFLSRVRNMPHIHTTHCPWTDASFRPKILRPFLFLNDFIFNRIAYSMIDKIIAITPWELDILKKYGDDETKIGVIPNGVDKILFDKISPNTFRKKYGITQKHLVLFFGRLNPTKGPEMLARAAIELSKKRKDIAFIWVGPDEGKAEEVQSLIKNYPNMKYIGPLRGKEKIAEMYQASTLYVLPSYREGLPLTLFEAMASGLAIVASPVNGVPFEMKEGENGFFSDYGNVENLAEKIAFLLDNKKLREEIAHNNFKKSQAYDWDSIAQRYINEYKKLVKKK